MLVVKDAMVLIHLSKLTLLGKSCKLFKKVMIPELVRKETVEIEKEREYEDAVLIEETIQNGLIEVKNVQNKKFLDRAEKFNIQSGEAEAVALYWEVEADFLATDDDNVRDKRTILELDLIGTPVIILKLYENNSIKKEKFESSLDNLREIGWFSNAVIDKTLERGEKYA